MNIAILNYYGKSDRGVEVWARELSAHSQTATFSIYFSEKTVAQDRSKLTIWQRLYIDRASLSIALWTLKTLNGLQNSDCIVPTNGGWQSLIIKIYSILKSMPVVIVGHSGIGWDDRINLYTFPNVFISLTENAKTWAKVVNPLVNVQVIPNGIDLDLFSKHGEKISLPFKGKTVLWVGALTQSKDPLFTLKAVSRLKNTNLLMVGSGGMENEVLKMGKELLGKKFSLRNYSWNEMPSVYRSCDVFTLASSKAESFGIVFLEAMASGLPVVTQDYPSRREICGDNAYYFAANDLDAYSKSIQLALDSKISVKIDRSVFGWDQVARKYESIFKKLIHEK